MTIPPEWPSQCLRTVLEALSDPAISTDEKGRIVFMNRAAEQVAGRRSQEVVGTPLSSLVSAGQRRHLEEAVQKLAAGEEIRDLHLYLLHRSGQAVPLSFTACLVRCNGNGCGAMAWFLVQRSTCGEPEDRLATTEREALLGRLAVATAYELRAPLAVVITSLYCLKDHLGSRDPKAARHLQIVDQELSRLQRIVATMLELACPAQREG